MFMYIKIQGMGGIFTWGGTKTGYTILMNPVGEEEGVGGRVRLCDGTAIVIMSY